MDLSVIVLNYNGRGVLRRCLDAVLVQRLTCQWEVLVVDNGSTDGSLDLLGQQYPEVRLVDAGGNRGFAGGNNLGIRSARGRYVVLLNNDAYPRQGFLAALLAAAETEVRAGAVTAKLLFAAEPDKIQNAGSQLLSDGSGADRGAGEVDRGQYDSGEEVFGFCGAAALLRREALEDVGLFDEHFFMYYEDTDLSWRLRLRGWLVVYEPAAVAEHDHAATSREWSQFFTFHVDRNRVLMLLKNARWGFALNCFFSLGSRVATVRTPAASRRSRPRTQWQVLGSLLVLLIPTLIDRRRVRGRRTVPDAAIERSLYSRELWDARSV
jgi:N-acetylglucosaminyl-diphospho-decaprenol L-rhamnosyltransferase